MKGFKSLWNDGNGPFFKTDESAFTVQSHRKIDKTPVRSKSSASYRLMQKPNHKPQRKKFDPSSDDESSLERNNLPLTMEDNFLPENLEWIQSLRPLMAEKVMK